MTEEVKYAPINSQEQVEYNTTHKDTWTSKRFTLKNMVVACSLATLVSGYLMFAFGSEFTRVVREKQVRREIKNNIEVLFGPSTPKGEISSKSSYIDSSGNYIDWTKIIPRRALDEVIDGNFDTSNYEVYDIPSDTSIPKTDSL